MRDRTAMTEPLTIGQQLVARWESVNGGWSEPADLAEAIDAAVAASRNDGIEQAAQHIQDEYWLDVHASTIRALKTL